MVRWREQRYTGKQDRETESGEEGRKEWGWYSVTQRERQGGQQTMREERQGGRRKPPGSLCFERWWQRVRPCLRGRRGWAT